LASEDAALKVHVQFDAPTKSLRGGERARLGAVDVRDVLGGARDLFAEDGPDLREDVGLGRDKTAELVRKREARGGDHG
jgi:hypothetical protein